VSNVLIDILSAVIGGESLGDVLAALSTAQWLTLAVGVAEELAPDVAEKLGLQHPSLAALVEAVGNGLSDELSAKAAADWFAANAAAAIREQPGAGSES
jgi:hypothetical protein